MKYVEQIKSFLLVFLVFLSVALTLIIWNYQPDYELIEETQVEEVLIGDQRQLQDVLKPYRVLFRENDAFTGTVSNGVLNELYRNFITWQVQDVKLINTDPKMNEIINKNNRATLFFNEEIPMQSFSNVLPFVEKDELDISFNRLIIDWSNAEEQDQLQLLFLNTEKRLLLQGYVNLASGQRFLTQVIQPSKNYTSYVEVERDSLHSLYVPQGTFGATKYTYLIDEFLPESFKNIVFPDPSIVQPNVENEQSVRYTDGTSLMTVDTQNRILNYVYPPAESIAPIPSSRLLLDSFEFVNDHGGFTSDFRLSSMNIGKHIMEYQLFLHGYPVYSNMTTTRIITTWGENRLFRYRRPYYSIERDIPNERAVQSLPSGEAVVEYLRNSKDYSFDEVDEIVVGYYLMQNPDSYILDPSWFIISDNVWTRITPEQIGGVMNGLE
ncbi:YycH family regulatory protein [Solibacillus daqui]|uniref:YycH family regulatory protein n=1 Tax=Solibacillus daqui TaxID=2912187 RepID=UPI002366AE19|nr:two-component system activity regulator YycH [Solibacillus daqui]